MTTYIEMTSGEQVAENELVWMNHPEVVQAVNATWDDSHTGSTYEHAIDAETVELANIKIHGTGEFASAYNLTPFTLCEGVYWECEAHEDGEE